MSLFGKKGKVVLTSEEQRDAFIEKLQNAHVDYRVFEIEDSAYSKKKHYVIRVSAADLAKVS